MPSTGSQGRPVVVGLGLKPASRDSDAPANEEGETGLSPQDKETFAGVMEMVIECLA